MDNKIVKTRKAHNCNYCGNEIPKGSNAEYFSFRVGRFDEKDNQIGVQYIKFHQHEDLTCAEKVNEQF